ncbi:Lsr2 dimerization domain-containing protein [Corynebacterium bovis]|uniref:Lsr2 dimerization domain-containing protein n=1 Tax=Corynebacterium bovis TaxID=36808 RepID=UPI000F6448C5|nr:histone-like nucleoid-structuring protein Lsr2 [Corynebacterium bovis]RRO90247.1 hypothetical protein CXF30_01160 [Corynebacterium bovis]
MATISTTTVVDNLDGTVLSGLPDDQVARITFAVGRRKFRLDLTADNAEVFHRDMERWTRVATPVASRRGAGSRWSDGLDPATRKVVRAWAAAHGYTVNAHGMIPRDVVSAWQDATGTSGDDELGQVAS